jgi:hypothetical protein
MIKLIFHDHIRDTNIHNITYMCWVKVYEYDWGFCIFHTLIQIILMKKITKINVLWEHT